MKGSDLSRYAGWSAMAGAGATILGLATLLLFYSLGEPWGTINDVMSMLLALSMAPLWLALYRHCRRAAPTMSLAAFCMGVLAILVVLVFQALLVLRVMRYEQTAVTVPAAFGTLGGTLMMFGYLQRRARSLRRGLAGLGMMAGAGYVLVIAGISLGGQESALTLVGGLMAAVCYPAWAIWFGRMLLLGQINFDAG